MHTYHTTFLACGLDGKTPAERTEGRIKKEVYRFAESIKENILDINCISYDKAQELSWLAFDPVLLPEIAENDIRKFDEFVLDRMGMLALGNTYRYVRRFRHMLAHSTKHLGPYGKVEDDSIPEHLRNSFSWPDENTPCMVYSPDKRGMKDLAKLRLFHFGCLPRPCPWEHALVPIYILDDAALRLMQKASQNLVTMLSYVQFAEFPPSSEWPRKLVN